MGDVAQEMGFEFFGNYLLPVAAPQQETDDKQADQTAEKQYLEGSQLTGQLPAADGHAHKRHEGSGHP
jgi:hypothetical protein